MSEWLRESGLYGDYKRVHVYHPLWGHADRPLGNNTFPVPRSPNPSSADIDPLTHQPALAAGAKRKVESGCEVRHAPAITGFTWLVHGSHGCSTFCLGAGWRPGSYRRERQHAKRDLFHSHIAGGSQIAMEKARAGYPRLCTCGIDLRCRFSLTDGGGNTTHSADANPVINPSLYAFGWQSLHVWQMPDHHCPPDMWYGP